MQRDLKKKIRYFFKYLTRSLEALQLTYSKLMPLGARQSVVHLNLFMRFHTLVRFPYNFDAQKVEI